MRNQYVNFCNKTVKLSTLPGLLYNSELISILKDLLHHFRSPTFVHNVKYRNSQPIFIFKKSISNIDMEKFVIDPSPAW